MHSDICYDYRIVFFVSFISIAETQNFSSKVDRFPSGTFFLLLNLYRGLKFGMRV